MITTIYLSPHSDDIAFCCGGSIEKNSQKGLAVLTIFSKSRYTETRALDNDSITVTETRTREDRLFCDSIGASYYSLGLCEANLRGYPDLQSLYEKRTGKDDSDYVQIEQSVVDFVSKYRDAKIFSPVGIGNHVEHLIAAEIALVLEQRGHDVWFYEDLPYALEFSMKEIEEIVARNVGSRTPEYTDISDTLHRKLEAIRIYESQVSQSLLEGIVRQSRRYFPYEQRNYERIWR